MRARAIIPGDPTEPSNEVVVHVGCVAAPAAPSGLAVDVSGTDVGLAWNLAPGTVDSFVVAGSASGQSDLAIVYAPGSALVTQAPPGTYFVRIIARNACGVSAPSNEVVVRIGGGP